VAPTQRAPGPPRLRPGRSPRRAPRRRRRPHLPTPRRQPEARPAMIELQQLTKRHRAGAVETTALDAIDLRIEAGEYVAISGPSGCGKSTLLGLLGLLDRPTSGRYRLQGEDIAGKNARELAALRRGRIGFVFQSFNLVEEMTV